MILGRSAAEPGWRQRGNCLSALSSVTIKKNGNALGQSSGGRQMRIPGLLRILPMALSLAAGGLLLSVPASAQKVVNFWHTEPNPKSKAAIDEIIKDFEKANPGIKVVQEAIAWGDLDKKMQTALASGAFPEIAHGQTYVERSLSAKGLLRPLNDVIEFDRRERHLRCGQEARLQHQGQEVLRHRSRGRHRPHRLPQGLHAGSGARSREGTEDLRRVEGDADQADRQVARAAMA